MNSNPGSILMIRGATAILLGLFALLWPGIGLFLLLLLVGAYALVDGILALWTAWNRRRQSMGHGLVVIEGVAGVLLGLMLLFAPGFSSLVLITAVAIWALITGFAQLMDAFSPVERSRTGMLALNAPRWAVGLSGLLSILFGVLLLAWPRAGITAIVWIIAFYALAGGVIVFYLGMRLRRQG